ncbi:translation initiation factor IF-2 [Streptomyces sp. NPDC088789]|uniref:WXG100 family type VII secretion target n=1 Tax=Streptomyces sp. NPDC088789 TaxID=3365899 RepID=UPI00382F1DA3
MAGGGRGGGTPFESMSHERMLAWLDQANAGTVQAAADRLLAVASEIHKIAEELKVRPQWVEWKGEGAEAFRTWAGDLANATIRLGDFSEDSATWLSRASTAIAQAQTAIPRDVPGAQANRDAANDAPNDPDSRTVSTKAAADLAALKADRERVRQEAAAQMRKLAQSYQVSATQLNALPRPKFPPPPAAIAPPTPARNNMKGLDRPGDGGDGSTTSSTRPYGATQADTQGAPNAPVSRSNPDAVPPRQGPAPPDIPVQPETRLDVNSVNTIPDAQRSQQTPPAPAPTPGPTRVDGGGPLVPGPVPPVFGGTKGPDRSAGPVRPVGTGRTPSPTGTGPVGPAPAPAQGRATGVPGGGGGQGIVGGRPGPLPGDRTSGIPRGVVVGGEGQGARGPVAPGATGAPGGPVGRPAGPQAQAPGGRAPLPSSGASPQGGVVGGSPQQQPGRAAGAAGSGGRSSGGTARGGITGGVPTSTRAGGTGTGGRSRKPTKPRTENRSGRRVATEDEETWKPDDGRRTVPPVIE